MGRGERDGQGVWGGSSNHQHACGQDKVCTFMEGALSQDAAHSRQANHAHLLCAGKDISLKGLSALDAALHW